MKRMRSEGAAASGQEAGSKRIKEEQGRSTSRRTLESVRSVDAAATSGQEAEELVEMLAHLGSDEEVEMLAHLGDRLPLQLVEATILPRLPPASLARARLVCTSWSSTISSQSFRPCWSQSAIPWVLWVPPIISASASTSFLQAYDSLEGRLHTFQLPQHKQQQQQEVLASAGGLILMNSHHSLAVWNPFTGSWKDLPPGTTDTILSVGMAYSHNTNSYQVLRCGTWESDLVTEVYDSSTGVWRKGEDAPRQQNMGGPYSLLKHSVWVNGEFFCFSPPGSLQAYSVDRGSWRCIRYPNPPPGAHFRGLAACGDFLVLLFAGTAAKDGSVQVMALALSKNNSWIKVGKVRQFLGNSSTIKDSNSNSKDKLDSTLVQLSGNARPPREDVYATLKEGKVGLKLMQHGACKDHSSCCEFLNLHPHDVGEHWAFVPDQPAKATMVYAPQVRSWLGYYETPGLEEAQRRLIPLTPSFQAVC